DVARLDVHVVLVRLRTELHFLELDLDLALTSHVFLLLLLVLELAVVHDLTDRRPALRLDVDAVELLLLREPERLARRKDTEHLALRADDADLGDADAVVRTRAGERGALCARIEAGSDDSILLWEGPLPFHERTAMMERGGAHHKAPTHHPSGRSPYRVT